MGARLLLGPGLPGLVPVTPAVALAGVGAAGARGLPRSATALAAGGGSDGVAIERRGRRDLRRAVRPVRPGGGRTPGPREPARDRSSPGRAGAAGVAGQADVGVACGLVIGRDSELGIGREAGRLAARARADGWHAAVLNGSTALHLARAGDPGAAARKPPPTLPQPRRWRPCSRPASWRESSTARPPGPGGRWRSLPDPSPTTHQVGLCIATCVEDNRM